MQLEELRSRVEWYEGRLRDLESTKQPQPPQQLAATWQDGDAEPSSAGTPSPCALQPPPTLTVPANPHSDAIPSERLPQAGQSGVCDAQQPGAPAIDRQASAELDTQQTLNDLLAASDSEATPRDASEREMPGGGTHAKSAAGGRFDADSATSPAQSCGHSCSTLSFEDGENTPQINSNAAQPVLPQPAALSKRCLRIGEQNIPEGPFTTDPFSPGSLPLGKSARALSARSRRAAAPTSFGMAKATAAAPEAPAHSSDAHVADSRAATFSASQQQRSTTSAAAAQTSEAGLSSRQASSRENCAPVGFGLGTRTKSTLSSPPVLGLGAQRNDDFRSSRGAEEAAVLATASESAAESARAPLSSITNQNADAADGGAKSEPAEASSAYNAAEEPFPEAVDASAACERRPDSSRVLQHHTSTRKGPSCMHGTHACPPRELEVSASVQVRIIPRLLCTPGYVTRGCGSLSSMR